ncbi:MAG: histidine phosphatase family protein, partial [Candidatus Limnocylindrales bacterium]
MPEILLVRHAPTEWSGRRYCGRSDPPLGIAGHAAAARLASALSAMIPRGVTVTSSPSLRALATAAPIAAALGQSDADIVVDAGWQEVDFGEAEGRTFDDLIRDHRDLADALARGTTAIDWPGGEAAARFEARVEAAWADVVARGEPAVVVAHAGPIRHVLALVRGLPASAIDLPGAATVVPVALPDGAVVLPSRT